MRSMTRHRMTKGAAARMYSAMDSLGSVVGKVSFVYALVRNKAVLKPYFDALQAARRTPDDARAYEDHRRALAMRFAVTDDKGVPIITSGMIRLRDDPDYYRLLGELQDQNQDAVRRMREHTEAADRLAAQDAGSIRLTACAVDDLPEMTPEMMEDLLPMLADDQPLLPDAAGGDVSLLLNEAAAPANGRGALPPAGRLGDLG